MANKKVVDRKNRSERGTARRIKRQAIKASGAQDAEDRLVKSTASASKFSGGARARLHKMIVDDKDEAKAKKMGVKTIEGFTKQRLVKSPTQAAQAAGKELKRLRNAKKGKK